MKTIGIIGGMTWHSSALYYQIINHEMNRRRGGFHSAQVLLSSLDFGEIEPLQRAADWSTVGKKLGEAAANLEAAGADGLIIASNTVHRVFNHVTESVSLPLIHITDALGAALLRERVTTVGILGTAYTMAEDFLIPRLADAFQISCVKPSEADQDWLHNTIYGELSHGITSVAAEKRLSTMIRELHARGAEAVALACTELSAIVDDQAHQVPVFDTARIHALAAVDWALK